MQTSTLVIESVKVGDLVLDPANARKHAPKNLEAIKGSLARFGQQKPIVVGKGNVVIAGNGTLEAARALGWATIEAVRTGLTGTEATAFALADNRTAELAEWDFDVLGPALHSLREIDFDLAGIGFDDSALEEYGAGGSASETDMPSLSSDDRAPFQQMAFKLHDEQVAQVQKALDVAGGMGPYDEGLNSNRNANALARICEMFVSQHG